MMRRRHLLSLFAVLAAARPFAAGAEKKAMPVVGWLATGSPEKSAPLVAAFRQGLHETGYIEYENVVIEYRWAYGHYDRLPELAARPPPRR